MSRRCWIGVLWMVMLWVAEPLTAREQIALNEGWNFRFYHQNGADAHSVDLPHTWNGDALAGIYPYLRTQGIYTREVYIPASWSKKRLFLCFKGVESRAELFVNGAYVGAHSGAGVGFNLEITDHLRVGEQNLLMVAVSNTPDNHEIPLSDERNRYGGITREVELLVTDQVNISPLYLGSSGLFIHTTKLAEESAEGEAFIHLSCPEPQSVEISLQATAPDGSVAFTLKRTLKSSYDFSKPVHIPFHIGNPRPWSPETPDLYHFTASIRTANSEDRVTLTTGLRQVSLTAERGVEINGQTVPIRGVALAYDHPHCASMLTEENFVEDMTIAREVGANALLSQSAPHDQALYALCDREGMLARIDLPFGRTSYLSDIYYSASPRFEAHAEELLREIIAQNLHHPSVVMWGLSYDLKVLDSRSEGLLRRLNEVAHAMDRSRPTLITSDQDGPINFIADGIVWHQRLGWSRGQAEDIGLWLNQMRSRWSHLRSAIHYGAEGLLAQQPDTYGRPTPHDKSLPERRQTRFHEEYLRQLAGDSLLWGHWVAHLSDFGSARRAAGLYGSGMVSFDRRQKKDIYYLYRARWNREARVLHIADKRWRVRPDQPQRLWVYASADIAEPLMLHNGDTVALEFYAPNIYLSEEFMLDTQSRIEVRGGGLQDTLTIQCGHALKAPVQRAPLQTIGLLPIN